MTRVGQDVLRRRLDEAPDADTALRAVDAQISRLAWSASTAFLPEVLPGAELALAKLAWLPSPSTNERYNEYGVDNRERVVLARSIVPEEAGRLVDDQLTVEYSDDRSWGLRYSVLREPNTPVVVWTCLMEAGLIVAREAFYRHGGYEADRFDWGAGQRLHSRTTTRPDGTETTIVFGEPSAAGASEPVDRETLVALLAKDLRAAFEAVPDHAGGLVLVSYSGVGDSWLDAAWPQLAVAFMKDLPTIRERAARHGWRAGWDVTLWPISEFTVKLSDDTREALEGLRDSVEDVDLVLREVVQTAASERRDGATYIAVDDELEQLRGAVTSLPKTEVRRLADLSLLP